MSIRVLRTSNGATVALASPGEGGEESKVFVASLAGEVLITERRPEKVINWDNQLSTYPHNPENPACPQPIRGWIRHGS